MMSSQNSSTHTPINITTFNVNGLGLDVRKQSIFNKLKSDNGFMLHRTHSTSTNEKNGKINVEVKLYFVMAPQTA